MGSDWVVEPPYLRCVFDSGDELSVLLGGDQADDLAVPCDFTVRRQTGVLHDGDLLDVTIEDGDGKGVIQTTDVHPFWSVSDGEWEHAVDLSVGEQLRQADGSTATVVKLTDRPGRQDMHDLTVEVDHNFYVDFGNGAVLVHNNTPLAEPFTPGVFVNDEGVTIRIYSNDQVHGGAPHAHVQGGGPEVRIGQNGHPVQGNGPLTAKQERVVQRHLSEIRSQIGKYLKWWKTDGPGKPC